MPSDLTTTPHQILQAKTGKLLLQAMHEPNLGLGGVGEPDRPGGAGAALAALVFALNLQAAEVMGEQHHGACIKSWAHGNR